MSINIELPLQATKYLPTSNIFTAVFNTPVIGKYSFNVPGNVKQTVIKLEPQTQYLIERLFISGDISEATFLNSLDPANIPKIVFSRLRAGAVIHSAAIPVTQFVQNREAPIWIYSDNRDDALQVTFSGVLNQTFDTVGKPTVNIVLDVSIYQISEKGYSIGLRTVVDPSFGHSLKTGR